MLIHSRNQRLSNSLSPACFSVLSGHVWISWWALGSDSFGRCMTSIVVKYAIGIVYGWLWSMHRCRAIYYFMTNHTQPVASRGQNSEIEERIVYKLLT